MIFRDAYILKVAEFLFDTISSSILLCRIVITLFCQIDSLYHIYFVQFLKVSNHFPPHLIEQNCLLHMSTRQLYSPWTLKSRGSVSGWSFKWPPKYNMMGVEIGFCAKYLNPRTTPFGRKVSEAEERRRDSGYSILPATYIWTHFVWTHKLCIQKLLKIYILNICKSVPNK